MSPERRPRAERVETTDLGHPALRRNELVALAELVRDACEGDLTIGLTDGGGEVGRTPQAFAEFAERSEETRPRELFIAGRRGRTHVTVILGHDSRVRVSEPDAVAKEAVAAMVEVVRDRQRRFTDRAWTGILLGVLGLLVTVGYTGVIMGQGLIGTGYGLGVVASLVVSLGFVLWGQSNPRDGEGARIVNTPRR